MTDGDSDAAGNALEFNAVLTKSRFAQFLLVRLAMHKTLNLAMDDLFGTCIRHHPRASIHPVHNHLDDLQNLCFIYRTCPIVVAHQKKFETKTL